MRIDDVSQAADAYLKTAKGTSAARLRLLKGLWDIQSEIEASAPGYVAPDAPTAQGALATGQPLFLVSKPEIPAKDYRAAVDRIAAYVADEAGLDPEHATALRDADFASALPDRRIAGAVRDSEAFVGEVSEALRARSEDAMSHATVAFILLSALPPFLTGPSAAALAALGEYQWGVWGSGTCPVCGSASALGYMTESSQLQGSERRLWCSLCHAEWSFERMRCVRCGTRAPEKLHYTHEESDSAHRVHLCDQCHGYLKVVFEDDLDKPLSMVVEDAVTVTLDAIACAKGYTPTGNGGQSATES